MKEQTFDGILSMICNSCNKQFYRGTSYDELRPEIVKCATQIYIAQMQQNQSNEK